MMKIIFLFLVIFISLNSFANQKWQSWHYVSGCRVYDSNGTKLREFPGQICLFLNDGSFISRQPDGLKRISKESEVLWHLPGYYHHMMSFSLDQSKIVTLLSEVIKIDDARHKYDFFQVISLDGKVLHQGHSKDYLAQIKVADLKRPTVGPLLIEMPSEFEATHFNSIYEFQPVNNKKAHPALKSAGKYILSGLGHGAFIVTEDLKTVVSFNPLKQSLQANVHDIQVLSNGNILYFNNQPAQEFKDIQYSSIDIIDPVSDKLVYRFTSEPKGSFFAPYCGSVQQLDEETLLFSDLQSGTYILSKKTKIFQKIIRDTHVPGARNALVQEVKKVDLSAFLSHW